MPTGLPDAPNSVYSFYRQLIQLRKNAEYHETLVYGQTVPYLAEQKNLMAYYRKGDKTILVMGNFVADILYSFADPRIKRRVDVANGK